MPLHPVGSIVRFPRSISGRLFYVLKEGDDVSTIIPLTGRRFVDPSTPPEPVEMRNCLLALPDHRENVDPLAHLLALAERQRTGPGRSTFDVVDDLFDSALRLLARDVLVLRDPGGVRRTFVSLQIDLPVLVLYIEIRSDRVTVLGDGMADRKVFSTTIEAAAYVAHRVRAELPF